MHLSRRIKAVVKSREIIDNWLSSALEYMKGNEEIKIKIAGKEFVVGRYFYANLLILFYEKEVEGISVKDGKIVIKTKAKDIIADDRILREGPGPSYSLIKRGWKYEDGVFSNDSVKFKYISYSVPEVFEENIYGGTDVSGKEVVDIGANVADSAIYFTLKGAKKVIGVEPLPNVYSQAIENVRLNGLENKISMINAAIGSKRGKLKVPCNIPALFSQGFSTFKKYEGDCEVPVLTLADTMKQITEPYLLKMDCEGCEFDIILNDYEHVRMFEKLIFEHHAKFVGVEYTKLTDKLRKDFRCVVTPLSPKEPKEKIGLFWCDKI